MEDRFIEMALAAMPSDPIISLPFILVPSADSILPEALLGVTFALILFRMGAASARPFREDRAMTGLLLVFFAVALLDVRNVGAAVPLTRWLRELIPIATLLLFFPLAAWFRRSPANVEFALRCFMFVACAYVIHSVYVGLMSGIHVRLTGLTPYNNFPFAALAFVGLLPYAGSFGPHLRTRRRILLGVLTCAVAVMILLQTRGGILASLAAVTWLSIPLLRSRRLVVHRPIYVRLRRMMVLMLWITAPLLFAYLGAGFIERMTVGGASDTQQWRVLEAHAAFQKFLANPTFGAGLGSEFVLEMFGGVHIWPYIHSSVFYYLANLGAIGFVAWISWWFVIARRLWAKPSQFDARMFKVFLVSGGGLIVLFTFAVVESTYRTYQNSVCIALFMAALHAALASRAPATRVAVTQLQPAEAMS
jgi:hypothetical protein